MNRKPKSSRSWRKTKKLITYFVLFLVVLGLAARIPLARGALFYQSYWGGAVFVPEVVEDNSSMTFIIWDSRTQKKVFDRPTLLDMLVAFPVRPKCLSN